MSYIHYKLITNQNYEKITFDGLHLSVVELKKQIFEKKFRSSAGSSTSALKSSMSGGPVHHQSNKKMIDVDLEITNVDTNESYRLDDMIPKNSRVQINRVVRNIGPALAGSVVFQTHKENEEVEDLKLKSKLKEEIASKSTTIADGASNLVSLNLTQTNLTRQPTPPSNIPDTIAKINDTSSSIIYSNFISDEIVFNENSNIEMEKLRSSPTTQPDEQSNKPIPLPPQELLCPFEDKETNEFHLITNAVIVPCCGYFISCESCIKNRLSKKIFIECPHETCLQEITSSHRLTPYKPIRQKVEDYYIKYYAMSPSAVPLEALRFATSLFASKCPSQEQELASKSEVPIDTQQVNSTKSSTTSSAPSKSKAIKIHISLKKPKPSNRPASTNFSNDTVELSMSSPPVQSIKEDSLLSPSVKEEEEAKEKMDTTSESLSQKKDKSRSSSLSSISSTTSSHSRKSSQHSDISYVSSDDTLDAQEVKEASQSLEANETNDKTVESASEQASEQVDMNNNKLEISELNGNDGQFYSNGMIEASYQQEDAIYFNPNVVQEKTMLDNSSFVGGPSFFHQPPPLPPPSHLLQPYNQNYNQLNRGEFVGYMNHHPHHQMQDLNQMSMASQSNFMFNAYPVSHPPPPTMLTHPLQQLPPPQQCIGFSNNGTMAPYMNQPPGIYSMQGPYANNGFNITSYRSNQLQMQSNYVSGNSQRSASKYNSDRKQTSSHFDGKRRRSRSRSKSKQRSDALRRKDYNYQSKSKRRTKSKSRSRTRSRSRSKDRYSRSERQRDHHYSSSSSNRSSKYSSQHSKREDNIHRGVKSKSHKSRSKSATRSRSRSKSKTKSDSQRNKRSYQSSRSDHVENKSSNQTQKVTSAVKVVNNSSEIISGKSSEKINEKSKKESSSSNGTNSGISAANRAEKVKIPSFLLQKTNLIEPSKKKIEFKITTTSLMELGNNVAAKSKIEIKEDNNAAHRKKSDSESSSSSTQPQLTNQIVFNTAQATPSPKSSPVKQKRRVYLKQDIAGLNTKLITK